MPAKGIFTLGVGHVRRKTIEPGSKADVAAKMAPVHVAKLNEREWEVLLALKREFAPDEIRSSPWKWRAAEAEVSLDEFYRIAEALNERKVVGRFSTFLEHVKPSAGGVRVTRFNALFPLGRPKGSRSRNWRRSRPASYSDALLLARSRPGIQERQHHGGGAWHGQTTAARTQARHR